MSSPTPATTAVTAQEIADAFDVHVRTVRQWARDGCPHERRERTLRFSLNAVHKWVRDTDRPTAPGRPARPKAQRNDDPDDPHAGDKDYWLARKYRNQCLEEERRLIDRDEVERQRVTRVFAVRSAMADVPMQAHRLVGLDEQQIAAELRSMMKVVCDRFADGQ